MGIRHAKPYTLRGGPSTKLGQRVRRRRERVVGFEETQNRGESRVERNGEGRRPSEEASRGNRSQNVNLPPTFTAPPHIWENQDMGYHFVVVPDFGYGAYGLPSTNSDGKPPIGEASPTSHKEGTYHRPSQTPMYMFLNMRAYANPNSTGLFPNPLGSVTPFVRWIEDYPLPVGLKMPSYIGSYNGKGDPNNFLHLFEGATRMQKWLMICSHIPSKTPLEYDGIVRRQIQEAINSRQLSYLVKGIKKEKAKSTDTPREEGKKDQSIAPVEAPILMISREYYATKNTVSESMAYKEEITFPQVTRVSNAPVIIEAAVFGRKVGRVYMDNGSTCEVIYEHCFEKLNPTIKATRVNTKTPLVGFSGKRSWSVGEVPLEIKIRKHPLSRTETLNFVIVKSDSPYNMLLGRTAMQKIRIVVSTIHGAIKFYTKKGVRTVLSVGEAGEETKKARRTLTISNERIPSCDDTEEKTIMNDKSNADIFAWTHADMTGIPRTIMVDRKPLNTEYKLNVYIRIKPIKQNKRSLGPDRSTTACNEAEELSKAGILRKSSIKRG
ncbi:reverse transcriptase domain-containing protein [Tanacetum coccineum]